MDRADDVDQRFAHALIGLSGSNVSDLERLVDPARVPQHPQYQFKVVGLEVVEYELNVGGEKTEFGGAILQRLILEPRVEGDGRAVTQDQTMPEIGLQCLPLVDLFHSGSNSDGGCPQEQRQAFWSRPVATSCRIPPNSARGRVLNVEKLCGLAQHGRYHSGAGIVAS